MAHTAQDLATFAKKKGFIYPSSEIYGGVAGLYDYGHLGTRLKHNFEDLWRDFFLSLNDNFHEIETANIMHHNVFKASGHIDKFADPLVHCSKCDFSERADHFLEKVTKQRAEGLTPAQLTDLIKKHVLACPLCKASLKPVEVMNMMFPLQMGVGSSQTAYLRPETAQSPYVNFRLQYELLRKKLPLGLALIGRAYRNEISPRNLTLRMREFTQAELQIFFNPQAIKIHPLFKEIENIPLHVLLCEDRKENTIKAITAKQLLKKGLPQFYVYHLVKIQEFYLQVLKIDPEKFRFYQLDDKEKAFYNKYHFDIEIELSEHGWTEVGGLHYRTDHDLSGHQKVSKQSMEVHDEETNTKFIPHVLELSFGVDRSVYTLLDLNYKANDARGNDLLTLPGSVAPYFCAVFPLVKNKEPIIDKAKEIYALVKQSFSAFYDEAASVGRRYARADEIGVRYCITVDFETLEDQAVTVRDRETMRQDRVKTNDLVAYLQKKIKEFV